MISTVARSSMRMRAIVKRNTRPADAVDAYRSPLPPDYQEQLREPCFAWNTSRIIAIDTARTARVEEMNIIFPRGTSVLEDDQVESIVDRGDPPATLFVGPFAVKALVPKVGHVQGRLERIGA